MENAYTFYDGSNIASHFGADFVQGPGLDDPLLVFNPGTDACNTGGDRAYFGAIGGRLVAFLAPDGTDCIYADRSAGVETLLWQFYASNAGAIRNSRNFTLERAGEVESLSYFRNRYYDAATGRFIEEDPIGFDGGLNLYAYAGNNPASYTDPFGLCPMCVVGAAWAVYEIGSGIYDAVNAARTVASPTATTRQKIGTVALAAVSIVAPGGGYTTIGDNLHHVRKVSSGRLGGFLRGDTELSGGLNAAQSTFKSLTGRGPTGEFDRVILQDGREVLFRGSSRSGPPKIELVDPNKKFLEKITFKQ